MKIVDPLLIKIHSLLEAGQSFPLNQALQHYGTPEDVEQLFNEVNSVILDDSRRFVLIDFSPFDRIGRLDEIVTRISKIDRFIPVFLVMSQSVKDDIFRTFDKYPIPLVYFNESGIFQEIILPESFDEKKIESLRQDLSGKNKYFSMNELRREYANKKLTELLFDPGCIDTPSKNDDESTIKYLGGRYYRIMHNKMLVSCYVNIKQIGKSTRALSEMAYEVLLELTSNFRRDIASLDHIDAIVTTNNTCLFVASVLQAIIEKPVVAVDRLGPIPASQLQSGKLRDILYNKKIIVLEDVIATGNEIDRAILFLHNINAKIVQIIAIYNLDVGKPNLVKDDHQLISLCMPREELKYVYRSQ